jgi:hypothetical protein
MQFVRLFASHVRKSGLLLFCLSVILFLPRLSAQTATNLVVDSDHGDVDQNEVDTFISFMQNPANSNAKFPSNALGDNLAYGTPGLNLEAINDLYRITGDMMVTNPNLAPEHMQLMNLAIAWSENFILLRNDQANGNHITMWTGNVDPVWQTYATGTAGYAGSENGDTAGHIVFTALNILQTPSIWNHTVPDGNPNHFGVTYLQRAQTYINMMEDTTQSYFTKYFINPTTFQIIAPTSPAWTVFNENMDSWNRQFLLTNDYLRLAQCHAILADNPTLQAFYTNIVQASTNAYVANALPVTATQTVSTLFPPKQAVYDSGYGNEGDTLGQITGNSASHTSYEFQGIARVYEAGPAYSDLTLANMERYANTVEYSIFDYVAYPPPGSYPPFNVLLTAPNTTAYYKNIDGGLNLPTSNATQDYLYGQFYFLTPYNTYFWQPAANGAAPNNHNNYHNNPYYTVGILYSKHWVYMHPQTLLAVAANSASTTAGGSGTYNITSGDTSPLTLSIPDLPAGMTASFNPETVPSGGSSTLTVTTSSTNVNGSSLFTLRGTDGTNTQTLGLTLVNVAPDFTISVTGTQTEAAGNSGTYTVTIAPLNGFSGTVNLAADPLYALAGTTVNFNPATLSISGGSATSLVTITTSATVPTPGGEWPQGFIGTSGAITHEAASRLTVNKVPQTINFPAISNQVYGAAPIPLPAATSQNQPITYTVTGSATLLGGNTLAGHSVAINGIGSVSVTAAQTGTTYDSAAQSVTQTFTVAPAILTVSAQSQSIVYGSAIPTLTSAITGFVNGDTAAVVSGSPALSTTASTASPAGAYPITAAPGTLAAANYTFTFVRGTLNITPATSSTAASVTPSPAPAGSPVTLSAVVSSTAGAPTGSVTFTSAGSPLCTAAVNASGVASCAFVPAVSGNMLITAQYTGDNNFQASTGTTALTIYDSSIKLQLASTQLIYPGATNVTACVTGATSMTATGSIQINDGATALTTQPLQGKGCAYWYISPGLAAGTHTLTAIYSGDKDNPAGISSSVAVLVNPVPVTLSASCWNSTFAYGANYQCTVNISSKAGAAQGSINYTLDGGTAISVPLSNGSAQFTIPTPAVGNHTVVIAYPQQTNYAAASLVTESFAVNRAPVNVSLTPSTWSPSSSSSVTLQAAVTSWSAGAPNANGSVSFYDGQTLFATVAVDSNGQASYPASGLPVGSNSITATYSGGANYATGSATIKLSVSQ